MIEKINPYVWNYTFPFHRGDKDEFFKMNESKLLREASLNGVRLYFLRDYNQKIVREGKNKLRMVVPYDVKSIDNSLELVGRGSFPFLSSVFSELSIPSEKLKFYDSNLMNNPFGNVCVGGVVIARAGFPIDYCSKSDIEYRCCLI